MSSVSPATVLDQPETVPIPQQPRYVDGKVVIHDLDVPSPLKSVAGKPRLVFAGLRRLILEDNSEVIGCADCVVTGTRGEIVKHRQAEHGAGKGGARKKDTSRYSELMAKPVADVMDLAEMGLAWEDTYLLIMSQRDEALERAKTAEQKLRTVESRLAKVGITMAFG